MMIVNTSITPMCSSRPTLSSTSSTPCGSPDSRFPTPIDTHAPDSLGSRPSAEAAPRNRNIVHSTLKIMNRISHAPPVCEP